MTYDPRRIRVMKTDRGTIEPASHVILEGYELLEQLSARKGESDDDFHRRVNAYMAEEAERRKLILIPLYVPTLP